MMIVEIVSSPEKAVARASALAVELSQSGDWEGYWILVGP
jgi:hypothetical protein